MGRWEIVALSWLDWALIVVLFAVVVMGFRRGFWISMGTVVGAIAGVLGGLFVMPVIVELVPAGVPRIVAMVAVTALFIWFGMSLGRKIAPGLGCVFNSRFRQHRR